MRKVIILFSLASIALVTGTIGIVLTWHQSVFTAFYCALGTASTVGCNTAPSSAVGELSAMFIMVTAVPLLAAAYSSATSLNIKKHVSKRLDEHQETITTQLNNHHDKIKSLIGN